MSPVTTSRKLFIAALLLAGGYAAFVLGPLAQSLVPGVVPPRRRKHSRAGCRP